MTQPKQEWIRALARLYNGDPEATLSCTQEVDAPDSHKGALSPIMLLNGKEGVGLQFIVTKQVGAGGMGVVHAALQETLDREVAVKRLWPKIQEDNGSNPLLAEALLLGRLDHPNIVPLYLMGFDTDGKPVLVMKYVRGVPWSVLLKDAVHPLWNTVTGDRLEWSIRVILQICNAVDYAHSKGILHRDIKPANIMIGYFGEVYLFDWGLALELGVDNSIRSTQFAGTPSYAAPEMFDPSLHLDQRTDVYLLGATLSRVLSGQPVHVGHDLDELMYQATLSEPETFGEHIDSTLAAICHRACHRDPNQRFDSVRDLGQALNAYLSERHSKSLLRTGKARLRSLQIELDLDKPGDRLVHRLFFESRFAFQRVLDANPNAEHAKKGIRTALFLMSRYELGRGDLVSARRLCAELRENGATANQLNQLEAALAEAQSLDERSQELNTQIQYKMVEKLVQLEQDSRSTDES